MWAGWNGDFATHAAVNCVAGLRALFYGVRAREALDNVPWTSYRPLRRFRLAAPTEGPKNFLQRCLQCLAFVSCAYLAGEHGWEQRRRRVGRAEGHAVGWCDARRALGATQLRANCERRDSQLDGPNALGRVASEERAATSVRRVGGEATLRALALRRSCSNEGNQVPEVSLRRRRVLLVVARSSPCGAARGNGTLAMNRVNGFRDACNNCGNGVRDCSLLARSA
jgi:hypothetical protein